MIRDARPGRRWPHSGQASDWVDAPPYVVTPIINPSRYRSRYAQYRDFEITNRHNTNHIQVRTNQENRHKENLINLGVSRLPPD
nr:hypothetical protein [uncultured Rhodopila sp.]